METHRQEIVLFADLVAGDEVAFYATTFGHPEIVDRSPPIDVRRTLRPP